MKKEAKIISMHDALAWLQQPYARVKQPVDITVIRATKQHGKVGELMEYRGVTALEGNFKKGLHRVRFPNGQIRAFKWWQLVSINGNTIYL